MARPHHFDYDLIVIGSGAAGSTAATTLARAGKRVAIVEADVFGGSASNWGDVPLHALLHAAQVYDQARRGSRFGLRASGVGYNYPSLKAWKELAVRRTGAAGNRQFYEKHGISAYNGHARFLTPYEITVNRRHLSAQKFLIATGAEWPRPTILGLDSVDYLTPRTILQATRPPRSLCIIGGDNTALEIAQLLATFGTKVHLLCPTPTLLPGYPAEASNLIAKALQDQGVIVLTHSRVLSVAKEGASKRILINRADTEKSIIADELLVADERVPNLDLGLENALVSYKPTGIQVNSYLQTTARHIYAAGEVIHSDHDHSTPTALLEGRLAAHNLRGGARVAADYTATPQVLFTSPQVARVGLSEADCRARGVAIHQASVPLGIIARSNTSDFQDGMVHLLTDKKGIVLGGTIVAPQAAEMIHEVALAVRAGLTAQQLAATPHAFLSWSEAIRVAASQLVTPRA